MKYIAVEGPIGAGKTTFSKLLSEYLPAKLILEDFGDNPFLQDFYKDRRSNAFKLQLFFLLSRFKQQEQLNQQELFTEYVITDFLFERDRIFAYLNLDERELFLYERIYETLLGRVPKADMVIYLQAPTEVLISRIKKRGRAFERDIDPAYLHELNRAYNRFFFHYDRSPLLVVKATDIEILEQKGELGHLIEEIKSLKQGTRYYSPPGSFI